jgi:hypothetical protein
VLKPGAVFALHDFAMTEKFDESIPEHRKVRDWIEFGNGMTNLPWVPVMRESLKKAGESSRVVPTYVLLGKDPADSDSIRLRAPE